MGKSIRQFGFLMLVGKRALQYLTKENRDSAGILMNYEADRPPDRKDDITKGYGRGSEIITKDGRFFKCVDDTTGQARWIEFGGRGGLLAFPEGMSMEEIEELKKGGEWVEMEKGTLLDLLAAAEQEPQGTTEPEPPLDQKENPDKSPGNEDDGQTQITEPEPPPPDEEKGVEVQMHEEGGKVSRQDVESVTENPKEKLIEIYASMILENDDPVPLPEDLPYKGWVEKTTDNLLDLYGKTPEQLIKMSYINRERAEKILSFIDEMNILDRRGEKQKPIEYTSINDAISGAGE